MKIKLAGKILAVTITSLMLVALSALPLAAEQPLDNFEYPYCCRENKPGWSGEKYSRTYNPNKLETLNGEVVSVDSHTSRRGVSQGVHLLVNIGKETVEVHLAPSWYLKNQDFEITPEDKIAITGSKIDINGEQAIIASQIKKGNQTLILRDENGFPLWHGWGR